MDWALPSLLLSALLLGLFLWHESKEDNCSPGCPSDFWPPLGQQPQPRIHVITPTRNNTVQRANLIRLGQTLRWVPNLHWIIIEDGEATNPNTAQLLRDSCVQHTYLFAPEDESRKRGRGMAQRNKGLKLLIDRYTGTTEKGVVFFGDDDNAYDVRLFQQMRRVKGVGIWGVGIVGGSMVETPKVEDGRVIGFDTWYAPGRKFATDMAGFAFSLEKLLSHPNASFHRRCGAGAIETCFISQLKVTSLEKLLSHPNASFHRRCGAGAIETCFISQLKVTRKDVEPLGFDVSYGEREILVWHTRFRAKARGEDLGYLI